MRIPEHQSFPDGTRVRFTDEARAAMHPRSVLDHPLAAPGLGEDQIYMIANTADLFHDVILEETGQRYSVAWFTATNTEETAPQVDQPSLDEVRFGWTDFESEPEKTGDGSGDPDMHFLTIYEHGEELATIAHRTDGGQFPLDGPLAEQKRRNAERIVEALHQRFGEV